MLKKKYENWERTIETFVQQCKLTEQPYRPNQTNSNKCHQHSEHKLMTADCKRANSRPSTPYRACKTCMIDVHNGAAQVSQPFLFRAVPYMYFTAQNTRFINYIGIYIQQIPLEDAKRKTCYKVSKDQ